MNEPRCYRPLEPERMEALAAELRAWRMDAPRPGRLERLRRFFLETLWNELPPATAPLRRRVVAAVQLLVLIVRGFRNERLSLQAGALTYRTLLALVPTLAVIFSLFDWIVGLERFEPAFRDFLVRTLAPGFHERVARELELAIHAIERTSHTGGVLASLALIWTVSRTIAGLDKTFRGIFGVRLPVHHRLRRLVWLWLAAVFAPALIGASIALQGALASSSVLAWLRAHAPVVVEFGLRLLPPLFSCLGFSALYALLASKRIGLQAALGGGVFAGLVFEAGKWGFARFAGELIRSRNAIYGSLGVVFVFMFWVYASWMIVLLGAQIAAAIRLRSSYLEQTHAEQASVRARIAAGLAIVAELARSRLAGAPPPSVAKLAERLALPLRLVLELLLELERHGLVRSPNGWRVPRYTTARAPEALSAAHVLEALVDGSAPCLHPHAASTASRVILERHALAERLRLAALIEPSLARLAAP